MTKEPAIHCHRSNTALTKDTGQQAIAIAEPILEAFGLDYQVETSQEGIVFHLGKCQDVTSEEAEQMDGLRRIDEATEELIMPLTQPHGFSLFGASNGPHAQVRWAASAETALAWRNAGLIRNYCDIYHWSRQPSPKSPAAVGLALQKLGLQQAAWYKSANVPDPTADQIAKELLKFLDDPSYAVILFGSRQRGDHTKESDVDLLVDWTGDWETMIPKARRAIARLRQARTGNAPKLDVSITEHWDAPIWNTPEQKLNPDGGSATVYAHSAQALTNTPLTIMQGNAPSPDGSPAHFLTDGVMVTGQHQEDYARIQYLCQGGCKR